MNAQHEVERSTVLITVKASPEIGRTHGETVCVAGIRVDQDTPRWIRLFPVPWQWFWGREHPKYQLIEVDVTKHEKDQRPESHRPRLDTTTVIRQKSSNAQRSDVLNKLPQFAMCDLVAAKGWTRPSLGLVVPREVTGFDWENHTGEVGPHGQDEPCGPRKPARSGCPEAGVLTLRVQALLPMRPVNVPRSSANHRRLGDLRGLEKLAP
jgi:hypothetical protein